MRIQTVVQKDRPVKRRRHVDDLRIRRWPRRLLYGLVLLALLGSAVAVGLPILCDTERARGWAAGWIARRVEGPVALQRISASWTGAVELHGVEIGPPPGFGDTPTASIQRVEVPGGVLGLIRHWGGTIPLHFDGVRLHIERSRSGVLSIDCLRRGSENPDAGGDGGPAAGAAKAIEWGANADIAVNAGALTYVDEALGIRASFRQIALDGSIRDGLPRRLRFSASAEPRGSLSADIEIPLLPLGEDGRPIFGQSSIRGEFAAEGVDLMPYAAILERTLHIRPPNERVSLAVKGAISQREIHLEKLLLDAGFIKLRGSDGRIRGPLSGTAEGAITLNIEGSIGRTLECLAALIPGSGEFVDGRLAGNLRLLAAADNLRLASELALNGFRARGGLLGGRELHDLALKVQFEGELAPSRGSFDVEHLVVDGPGLMLRAGGSCGLEAGHPVMAKGEALLDLQAIRPLLDPLLGWKAMEDAKGRLGIAFETRTGGGGFQGSWKVSGEDIETTLVVDGTSFRLAENDLTLELKTAMAGPGETIRVSGGKIAAANLAANFLGTVGPMRNPAEGMPVDLEVGGQLGLRDGMRRLRPLLPEGIAAEERGSAGFQIHLSGKLGAALRESLAASGILEGSGLIFRGLRFETFTAPLRLDKGVLSFHGFSGTPNGGRLNGSFIHEPADGGPGRCRLDLRTRGVELPLELLPLLAPAAPFLAGIRGRSDFSGAVDLDLQKFEWETGGGGPAPVVRGAGNLSIRNGHLSDSPLAEAALAMAALPPGTLRFKEITTAFQVTGGRVRSQDLRLQLSSLHSVDRTIQLSGSTGLGGSLDYILRLGAIEPQAEGKKPRQILDVLEGALGEDAAPPIRLRGSLERPNLVVDLDDAAPPRAAGRNPLRGRFDGLIEKKLGRAGGR